MANLRQLPQNLGVHPSKDREKSQKWGHDSDKTRF